MYLQISIFADLELHVFDVFLDQQDSWIWSLKVKKVKVNFHQMSFLYIQLSEIGILGISTRRCTNPKSTNPADIKIHQKHAPK